MQNKSSNISMPSHYCCSDCGWPIIIACCNDEFMNFKYASECDWWYYCSNKGCKNHEGEGACQDTPEWCLTIKGDTNAEE